MNEALIIVITVMIFTLSLGLFSFSVGSFRLSKINMISYVLYKDVMIFSLVGVILAVLNIDELYDIYFWAISGHASHESRLYGWLAMLYFLIAFPFGMIVSNLIVLRRLSNRNVVFNYMNKKTVMSPFSHEKTQFYILIIFSIISTLSLLYVYTKLTQIPLISMFHGAGSSELAVLRADAKLKFQGSTVIRDMVALKLPALLSYVVYALYRESKQLKYKVLFYYLFFISFLALTYNLQKTPFVFYLLGFLFIKVLLGEVVKAKLVIISLFKLFLILIVIFILVMGVENIYNLLGELAQRILVAQTSAIFLAFEYFPSQHEFLGVSSVSGFVSDLLAQDKLYYGRVMFEIYNPQVVEAGKAGFIVGNLIAESWALFGIGGLLFLPIWSGFFVATLSNLILMLPKSPLFLALYAFMTLSLSITGGVAQFINFTVFLSPFYYIAIIILCAVSLNIILKRKNYA